MKVKFLKLWNSLGYFERTTSERPYLPKASILRANCLGDAIVPVSSDDSIQNLSSKFDLVPNVMN